MTYNPKISCEEFLVCQELKEISRTKVETLIINLGGKSAIKLVSKEKQKNSHKVFGVVQSFIRTENLKAIF